MHKSYPTCPGELEEAAASGRRNCFCLFVLILHLATCGHGIYVTQVNKIKAVSPIKLLTKGRTAKKKHQLLHSQLLNSSWSEFSTTSTTSLSLPTSIKTTNGTVSAYILFCWNKRHWNLNNFYFSYLLNFLLEFLLFLFLTFYTIWANSLQSVIYIRTMDI